MKKTSSPIESDDELRRKISDSVWDLQHIVKQISREKNKIAADMALIIHASKRLAIQAEILEHENRELHTALIEKKRRWKKENESFW